MQNGCATFLVMACSQNTCSGHCTTADLRMRLSAYGRPVDSSARTAMWVEARRVWGDMRGACGTTRATRRRVCCAATAAARMHRQRWRF